jgi:hypothetical protein
MLCHLSVADAGEEVCYRISNHLDNLRFTFINL